MTYFVFNCYLFFHFVRLKLECCNFHRKVSVNLLKYMLRLKNNCKLVKSVNLFGEIDTNISISINHTTLHRPILAPVQKQCIVKYGKIRVNMIGRQFGSTNLQYTNDGNTHWNFLHNAKHYLPTYYIYIDEYRRTTKNLLTIYIFFF